MELMLRLSMPLRDARLFMMMMILMMMGGDEERKDGNKVGNKGCDGEKQKTSKKKISLLSTSLTVGQQLQQ
jgi:hypothetical protein